MFDFTYCEAGPIAWFPEPLNIFSSLVFLLAFAALHKIYRRGTPDRVFLVMIWLVLAIGVGSMLWHSTGEPWALALDIAPIALLVPLYLLVFTQRVFHWHPALAWLVIACVFLCIYLASLVANDVLLQKSNAFVPVVLVLGGLALYLRSRDARAAQVFLVAALCFALAIACRALDIWLCASLPMGTHFLWHIFSAVTVYLLVKDLMRIGGKTRVV